MQMTTEDSPVLQKTRELCQTIVDQPNMRTIRERIDAFMADESARGQYDSLMGKGQTLQNKQQQGLPLSGEEIDGFEKDREALLNNPVARGFLDAQQELHEVQHSVHRYISKTLELGRMPTEEDLAEGSRGSGCSCEH